MEVQKITEIKIESELIEQLFRELEKLKKHELKDMTPFKGGLPKIPLVVGLIFKLPNGVNNSISKFLGFERRHVKEIQFHMNRPLYYKTLWGFPWWRAQHAPNELLHRVMENKFPKLPVGTERMQAWAFLRRAKGGAKHKIPELRRTFERFPNHIKYQIFRSAWERRERQMLQKLFPRESIEAKMQYCLNNCLT